MKKAVLSVFTILCIAAVALAQGGVTLTFDQLFPPAKQRSMGLHKLTRAQKAALKRHVESLLMAAVRLGEAANGRPSKGLRAPAGKTYIGVGNGHWIKKNIDRGAFILLEDRSLWQIDPLDKIDALLWLNLSEITVVESDDGSPGFNYLLINTDDGEKAHAKYMGKQ